MTTVYSDDVTKDSVSSSLTALAERGLSSAAASMQSLADSLVAQAATSQSRADLFRSQIANLNEITASAYAAMQNANSASFDAALYARIEAAKVELGKAASYFDSALQAATIGQNIGALGKSIGAVVGAIDLLGALNRNSPQADVSKEAIVASIGLAVGMATAGLGLGTGIGAAVLTGLITKAMWDDFISPQLQGAGIDLTRPFWDALIEDWGIVDGVNAISRILGTDPDPLVRSVKYVPRTDPLVLDLDGDGFEITAVNRTPPILFDNNADTVKTATAWVNSDDGLLVLDRNGNGMIDSGRELFGDETVLADGSKASNGFTALASLDSNADGQFTALDTQFNAVRVWRDLNQDGVSQAGELKTLVASGITRIGLTASNVNQSYGDAQLQQTGTFTRADGSVGQAGSFLFATNSFMREFAPITISAAAAALPNIGGSGWARDLREAATQSPELIDIVNAARNATTRSGYKAAIDNLLREWGNDSSYHSFIDLALNDGYGLILSEPTNAQERGWMDIAIKGTETARSVFRGSLSSTDRVKFDAMRERMVGDLERLTAYEAFTGFTFLQLTKIYGDAFYPPVWAAPIGTPIEVWVPLSQKLQEIRIAEPAAESGYILITMPPPMGGLPHLTALWNRILDDATDNLMPSLRLAKYLDQVDLVISDTAATLNFDTLNATLLAERTSNPVEGIAVLFDLYRFYGAQFDAIGWNGGTQVRALISAGAGDSSIRAGITNAGFNFVSGSAALTDGADAYSGTVAADSVNSGVGNDIVVAGSGADTISGGVGNDLLFGDAGNDLVMGEDGNDSMDGGADLDDLRGGRGSDTLLGGAGNDTLYGFTTYNVGAQGTGNSDTYDGGAGDDQLYDYEISDGDVYRLNLGGGADTVRDDGGVADRIDIGAGIATTATKVRNVDGNLIVSLSSGERLTVNGAYDGEGNASSNAIEEIRFAAGTSWDAAAIRTQASTGSALADRMDGFGGNDTMTGAAGNDTVLGAAGNDSIDGGADLDDLRGGRGSDTLLGGAGNDTLYGFTTYNVGAQGTGNSDTYDGGAGDDQLYDYEISDGDVYRLNLGGGADTVRDDGGVADRIEIGAGIATTATKVRNVDGNLVVSLGSGERLTVNGAYDGEGNVTSNAIEEIRFATGTSWDAAAIRTQASTGSAAADVLQAFSTADSILAGDGNDVVWARAGDDTINGGLGTDTMYGGLGNDTYLVDAATDVVTESLNEGTDTVQSSVSLTLGANVENLTLTGTGTLNGTGNTLANVLTGNASANALIGDAGNDTLNGGAGNDVLTGGTGADTYLFGAGSGIDTVQENDGSAGVVDVVSLAGSLTQANLQFAKVGNNLEMLITGSADKMVFKDWYLGSAYHVEQFRFSNATVLTDTQAQGMVSAMAAFSAPAAAVTTTGQLGQTAWMQPAIAVSGVA